MVIAATHQRNRFAKWRDWKQRGFGQMNEPPDSRFRVLHESSRLTLSQRENPSAQQSAGAARAEKLPNRAPRPACVETACLNGRCLR